MGHGDIQMQRMRAREKKRKVRKRDIKESEVEITLVPHTPMVAVMYKLK